MKNTEKASFSLDESHAIALLRQSLELNEYEAKTYFSMLLLGRPHSAKDIGQKASVPVSRVYQVLKDLEAAGFIKEVFSTEGMGTTKLFVALSPKEAYKGFILKKEKSWEKQKQSIEALIEEFQPISNFLSSSAETAFYELLNLEQAKLVTIQLIDQAKSTIQISSLSLGYFHDIKDHLKRAILEKDVKVRILLADQKRLKPYLLKELHDTMDKISRLLRELQQKENNLQVRFWDLDDWESDEPPLRATIVDGSSAVFLLWPKKGTSSQGRSHYMTEINLAEYLQHSFDLFWVRAKR